MNRRAFGTYALATSGILLGTRLTSGAAHAAESPTGAEGAAMPYNERIALGLPSLAGYTLTEGLEKARQLGFQSIMTLPGGPNARHSLGAFPTLDFHGSTEAHRRKLKAALAPFKHVSLHQAWDTDWQTWIECARCVGARIVTVHAGRRGTDQTPRQFIDTRRKFLLPLTEAAGGAGIRIGLENEGGAREDYLALIEAVGGETVGATIDVGHCAYFSEVAAVADGDERVVRMNDLLCALVDALGGRLYHFHVHNVRKADWRDHRSVPDGVVDYARLFARLDRIGYGGLFDIELEEPEMERQAARSGQYLSDLCRSRPRPA
ncbi:MAG: sugar phosphate isomerase/epimerase [bacterium]|nr:sugar phosphate isomerase/epimerase [bacterium]